MTRVPVAEGVEAEGPTGQSTAPGAMPQWLTWGGAALFAASVTALAVIESFFSGQPWSMLDLRIYRWAGLVVRHSGDLYGLRFPGYHLGFTYSPMAALIFAAMSVIALPALKWLVTTASVVSLVATMWITWGALGYRRDAGRVGLTLAAAGIALCLEPVRQTLLFGQVNLVLMLVVVADLALDDRRWFKGAGVGLAAGFKLTPLIFIGYLLFTRRFRATGVALATFALTIAGSFVLLPAQSRKYWLDGLFWKPRWIGNIAYVGNQSLRGALTRLLGAEPAALPYWLIAAVLVGAVGLALVAWAARRGHEMLAVVTCALIGLLISPVSWPHHWVWIAPALVVAADLAMRMRTRRWAGWACVAVLAIAFLTQPRGLVSAGNLQGSDVDGVALLIGSMYVIVGIAAVCLVAFAVAAGQQSGWIIMTEEPGVEKERGPRNGIVVSAAQLIRRRSVSGTPPGPSG